MSNFNWLIKMKKTIMRSVLAAVLLSVTFAYEKMIGTGEDKIYFAVTLEADPSWGKVGQLNRMD